MSVVPESFNIDNDRAAGSIRSEAGLRPRTIESVLKGAAFVSSTGQVYRLFPDNEASALGVGFSIPVRKEEKSESESLSQRFKLFPDSNTSSNTSTNTPRSSGQKIAPLLFGLSGPLPIDHPIDETFKRLRAVEGICGRRQKTMTIQMLDSLSEKIRGKSNPTARNQAASNTPTVSNPAFSIVKPPTTFPVDSNDSKKASTIERIVEKPILDMTDLVHLAESKRELFEIAEKEIHLDKRMETVCDENSSPEESVFFVPSARNEPTAPSIDEPLRAEAPSTEDLTEDRTFSIRLVHLDLPASLRRSFQRPFQRLCRKRPFENTKKAETPPSAGEIFTPSDRIRSEMTPTPEKAIENQDVAGYFDETTHIQELLKDISKRIREIETEKELPFKKEARITIAEKIETEDEREMEKAVESTDTMMSTDAVNTADEKEPTLVSRDRISSSTHFVSDRHTTAWRPKWPEHVDSLEQTAIDQINSLCDHLVSRFKKGLKVVSFNSFYPEEGCTTIVLCAGRELAARGYHVLLVDSNVRNPELPRLLDVPFDPTLYEIISLEDRLDFLPWSESAIETDFNGKIDICHFEQLIAEIKDDYDLVVLDDGRLSEGPLPRRVEAWNTMHSDGVLLIVNKNNADRINLQAIAKRLKQHDVDLVGVIENYVRSSDREEGRENGRENEYRVKKAG